jgi:hypothetical protein
MQRRTFLKATAIGGGADDLQRLPVAAGARSGAPRAPWAKA